MEAEDPLSQLKDIHIPEAVTFWPPAPGWWLLLALALVGLAFLCRHLLANMLERRRLGMVLSELDRALQTYSEESAFDHNRNQAGLDYLASVNNILKRVAQTRLPETDSALLTGKSWLAFLDQHGGSSNFTGGPGQPLGDAVYRRNFEGDVRALHEVASAWIEHCYTRKTHTVSNKESVA